MIEVNLPWIEIGDRFVGDGTCVVNINDISAVYDVPDSFYKYGIRFKDGSWDDKFSTSDLRELKMFLMGKKKKEDD